MRDVEFGRFIWDDEKEKANIKKHGIGFKLASRVFEDPKILEFYDDCSSSLNEDRYNVIGLIKGILIVFVVATDREDKMRIISARKANFKERRKYLCEN